MIKANELRLLNYLQWDKNVFQVKEIKILKNRFNVNGRPPSYYEGINLTEEWLLKCGFYLDEKRDTYKHKDKNIEIDLSDNMVCISDSWEWKEVYFIHQLQNLYFALTNTELEIKP